MSGKMWEVDPETKQKLAQIQKKNGNNNCVDCGGPGPQWASPKFGVFMCLSCSGVHRGLGVHISFIRSITMDAFKNAEIVRMENGGNQPFKEFWEEHDANTLEGKTWDDATIRERYDSDVGEEWKARLTAKVEGREYVPGEEKKAAPAPRKVDAPIAGSRSSTPSSAAGKQGGVANIRAATSSRSQSPALGTMAGGGRKAQNEAYFARMGAENASRPDDLPPNQGGKFTGFGSDPFPSQKSGGAGMPGADEFQKDPLAALTKGFGWFGGIAQKAVGEGMQRLQQADLQTHARSLGTTVASSIQPIARNTTDVFNRFVEGDQYVPSQRATGGAGAAGPRSAAQSGPDPERRDFWDSFAAVGEERMAEKQSLVGGGKKTGPDSDRLEFWDDFAAAGEARAAASKTTEAGKPVGGAAAAAAGDARKSDSIGTSTVRKPKPGDDDWSEW